MLDSYKLTFKKRQITIILESLSFLEIMKKISRPLLCDWCAQKRISLRASIFFVRVYFVRLCQTLLQFHLGGIDNTWNKHKNIGVLKSKPCQELIQADLKWNYEICIEYMKNDYSEAYMEFKVYQYQIYWKYF